MLSFSSGERRQLAYGGTQTFESVHPAEFYSADDAGRVAKAAG